MRNLIVSSLKVVAIAILAGGCASVQRSTSAAQSQVKINLKNNDYTILDSVKGSSTLKSYPLGIVQIIDDSKVRVLGIKFFKDEYSLLQPKKTISTPEIVFMVYVWPYGVYKAYTYSSASASAQDRAYYKALSATPDADNIIQKSFVKQRSGIPFLYSEEEVTIVGKAIKYKP
jgi:hypothetical protein